MMQTQKPKSGLRESGVVSLFKPALAFVLGLIFAAAVSKPGLAMDPRTYASLRRLDPDMRLEQICDIEAMQRISREMKSFRPDRAKSDVISHPEHLGDILRASGGAFRNKGQWYAFSFVCTASADHLKVLAFDYHVGKLIPKSDWPDYGLW
jgi:hypothetical protein